MCWFLSKRVVEDVDISSFAALALQANHGRLGGRGFPLKGRTGYPLKGRRGRTGYPLWEILSGQVRELFVVFKNHQEEMKAGPSPDRILVHGAPTSNMEHLKPMTFIIGKRPRTTIMTGDLFIWA